jgi:ABC-2 type transport system permease protein
MRLNMVRSLYRKELSAYRAQFVGNSKAALAFSTATYIMISAGSPLLIGNHWFEATPLLVAYPVVASTFVIHSSVDTIAGERERHTLETLLASPVRESEITASKVLGGVFMGLSLGIAPLIIGVIALNLAAVFKGTGDGLLLPASHLLWGLPLLAMTLPAAMTSVGVLVSFFGSSLRNAMQSYSFALVGLMIVGSVIAVLLPPDITRAIDAWAKAYPGSGWFALINIGLALLTLITLMHVHVYFRRGARQLF